MNFFPNLRIQVLRNVVISALGCIIVSFSACDEPKKPAEPQKPPTTQAAPEQTPVYRAEVIGVFRHDASAFTQGLVVHDGVFYESTGQNGQSSLRKTEIETGKVLKKISLPYEFFAEGMTIFKDKIYQITWQSRKAFRYDLATFAKEKEFSYSGEGWGLTHDGKSLIMSDGTNQLRFLDPETFAVQKTIDVIFKTIPLKNLNELEYINGEIYANIWQTSLIARINPSNGKVVGMIDLSDLRKQISSPNADVLNGIAFDTNKNRLFVTGKNWDKLFEIRLEMTKYDITLDF